MTVAAQNPCWRRLERDRKGVSVVEFALIYPALILLLMGLCDIGDALISDRKLVETAEALAQGVNALMVPAQCTVTSWSPTPTQTCTPATLSKDSLSTLQNVLNMTMAGTNTSTVSATVFRVVNNNGSYTVTNAFVIASSSAPSPDLTVIAKYLPVGGTTLVATINYSQHLAFPFLGNSIALSTSYSL